MPSPGIKTAISLSQSSFDQCGTQLPFPSSHVFFLSTEHNPSLLFSNLTFSAFQKAIKTRQKMEVNQERRNRQRQMISQLSTDSKDEELNLSEDNTKKEDYEEPPPRPPTRRW